MHHFQVHHFHYILLTTKQNIRKMKQRWEKKMYATFWPWLWTINGWKEESYHKSYLNKFYATTIKRKNVYRARRRQKNDSIDFIYVLFFVTSIQQLRKYVEWEEWDIDEDGNVNYSRRNQKREKKTDSYSVKK